MDERLPTYLDVIRRAATDALSFVQGFSQEAFLSDEKTKAAVVMTFIRIGEMAARIEKRDPAFVAKHADWPWTEMRAMRNRGVHGYEALNFNTVWVTVVQSLPLLVKGIDALGPLDPRDQIGS